MSTKLLPLLFPPIRLSIALLLLLFAGAWIYLNVIPHAGYFPTPYWVCVTPGGGREEMLPGGERIPHVDPTVYEQRERIKSTFGVGFPLKFPAYENPSASPFQGIAQYHREFLFNLFSGLILLWSLARFIDVFSPGKTRTTFLQRLSILQRRVIPPIRISTAIVLMFAAGGWIWLNCIGIERMIAKRRNTVPQFYSVKNPDGRFSTVSINPVWEVSISKTDKFDFGFPFEFSRSASRNVANCGYIEMKPIVVNLVIGLFILWSLAWLFTIIWPNKVVRVRHPENVPKAHEH